MQIKNVTEKLKPCPFCGDFAKCNNAEGCDTCAEFERWAEESGK